jgi:glycosyltransferase involved in cell wall biosynthesis
MTATREAPVLSVLVVAHNEEARLPACLACLGFADEIVVLLDKCTDGSDAIARGVTGRVLAGRWDREGERRNAGIDFCRGQWILEVDADERVPAALAAEIRATVKDSVYDWHEIPVDNYIGAALVRNGWGASFGKAAYPGLFRKGAKTWGPDRVHPRLIWRGRKGPMLANRLEHHVDRDISDMVRRLDAYSTARARDLRERGDPGSVAGNVRRFFSRFFKCYVGRKGYKEGGYGFLIALFAGLFPLLSHIKAVEESD